MTELTHVPEYGLKDGAGKIVKPPKRCAYTNRPLDGGIVTVHIDGNKRVFYRLTASAQRAMTPERRAALQAAVMAAVEEHRGTVVQSLPDPGPDDPKWVDFGLGLDPKVNQLLTSAGCNTVDDVSGMALAGKLTAVKGIGPATATMIEEALELHHWPKGDPEPSEPEVDEEA